MMKNITHTVPTKYDGNAAYTVVADGIYQFDNPPDEVIEGSEGTMYRYGLMTTSRLEAPFFVTSLSFEQEPEYGEGEMPAHISQYPLEDILDSYNVWVSDFYKEANEQSPRVAQLEFGASRVERLVELRKLIGKHVYNHTSEDDGRVRLIVE